MFVSGDSAIRNGTWEACFAVGTLFMWCVVATRTQLASSTGTLVGIESSYGAIFAIFRTQIVRKTPWKAWRAGRLPCHFLMKTRWTVFASRVVRAARVHELAKIA
jgi:hypothetical protein